MGWRWMGQELGGGLGGQWRRPGPVMDRLIYRMIPKEQKEPVMAAMSDQAGPGKVDPALVHSSDPILPWSQIAATQACWPQAYKNRCEFQVSPEGVPGKSAAWALDQAWPQLSLYLSPKQSSAGSGPRSSLNWSPKLPTRLSLLIETVCPMGPL